MPLGARGASSSPTRASPLRASFPFPEASCGSTCAESSSGAPANIRITSYNVCYTKLLRLLGEGKPLRRLIETDQVASIIFWGPPGTGKTTLAQVISASTSCRFVFFSAVLQGVKEVREIVKQAQDERAYQGRRTLLRNNFV